MVQKKTNESAKDYESIAGLEGRIKLDILITEPKTVVTVKGKLDDATSLGLRYVVDGYLKDKGY